MDVYTYTGQKLLKLGVEPKAILSGAYLHRQLLNLTSNLNCKMHPLQLVTESNILKPQLLNLTLYVYW